MVLSIPWSSLTSAEQLFYNKLEIVDCVFVVHTFVQRFKHWSARCCRIWRWLHLHSFVTGRFQFFRQNCNDASFVNVVVMHWLWLLPLRAAMLLWGTHHVNLRFCLFIQNFSFVSRHYSPILIINKLKEKFKLILPQPPTENCVVQTDHFKVEKVAPGRWVDRNT